MPPGFPTGSGERLIWGVENPRRRRGAGSAPKAQEVYNMGNTIHVTMLGKFTLWEEGMAKPCEVSLTGRSRRLWILVAYLILHRDRGVPAQELIDLLWPDASSGNPVSTLQNNASRARSALTDSGFSDARRLVACEDGLYRWAPDRETELDSDIFERLARQALSKKTPQDGLPPALEAVQMYHGDLLSESAAEFWCGSISTYYRSLYIRLCRAAVSWLMEAGRMVDAERLCSDVLQLDPAAEEFSVCLMRALIMNRNPKKALEHYEHTRQLYQESFGVVPGAQMEAEKTEAIRMIYGHEIGEQELGAFLSVSEEEGGAFYCDNGVFREIVKLQLREMRRSRGHAQILLVQLNRDDLSLERQAVLMKQLENTLASALRAGDPFTRMGISRYMVLLMGATRENAQIVSERILNRLQKDFFRPARDYCFRIADLEHLRQIGSISGERKIGGH